MGVVGTKISWKPSANDKIIEQKIKKLAFEKYSIKLDDNLLYSDCMFDKSKGNLKTLGFYMGGYDLAWYTDAEQRIRSFLFECLIVLKEQKAECVFAGVGALNRDLDSEISNSGRYQILIDDH